MSSSNSPPSFSTPSPTPQFDPSTTLEAIRHRLDQFSKDRDWDQFHTPRNLLCALVGEVGELSEIFQWKGEVQPGLPAFTPEERTHLSEELADVLSYLIRLSDRCHIDLATAIWDKIAKNSEKYPVHKAKGSSEKYTSHVPPSLTAQIDAQTAEIDRLRSQVAKLSKPTKLRPTHFVSFRIVNPTIKHNVDLVQQSILSANAAALPLLIESDMLHMTLGLVRLENNDECERARQSFVSFRPVFRSLLRSFHENGQEDGEEKLAVNDTATAAVLVSFAGLGVFGSQTLWAGVKGGKESREGKLLRDVAGELRKHFLDNDVVVCADSFEPHVTIAKASRLSRLNKKLQKTVRKVGGLRGRLPKAKAWKDHVDIEFGVEEFVSLELSIMDGKYNAEDGFYGALAAIDSQSEDPVDLNQFPFPPKENSGPKVSFSSRFEQHLKDLEAQKQQQSASPATPATESQDETTAIGGLASDGASMSE